MNVAPASSGVRISLIASVLAIAGTLLFARLGHYALWDDEANTAMYAHGVWETGDTYGMYGRNLVAFQEGAELVNLKARWFPPLQYYLVAPFVGRFGMNSFAARLPFAILGLGTVALMLLWTHRSQASIADWVSISLAILANVSLFLYFRQCRYYGLTIALSVAVAYLYTHWENRPRQAILLAVALVALLASNYLTFIAICLCAGVDIMAFNRRPRCSWPNAMVIGLPVILIGAMLVMIYSPLGKGGLVVHQGSWLSNHFHWLWWNLRDANACEFGVGPLILVSPLLISDGTRRRWAWRGLLALFVFALFMSIASPHGEAEFGELRYLCPVIPLCIALGAMGVAGLARGHAWIAGLICLPIFFTNFVTLGGFDQAGICPVGWRSTPLKFAHELISPPSDPYTETANWIDEHLPAGKTAWVCPDYGAFPLMVQAPGLEYGWQLAWPPQEQFKNLDPIQFKGMIPPDYIIAFGDRGLELLHRPPFPIQTPTNYHPIAMIPFFFQDEYKPELFSHAFSAVKDFDPQYKAIYVWQRIVPTDDSFHL